MEQRGFWSRVLDRLIGFVLVLTNTIALIIGAPLYLIGMPILIVVFGIIDRSWDWRDWAIHIEFFWRSGICGTCHVIHILATEGFMSMLTLESVEYFSKNVSRIWDEIENRYYEDEEE